MQLWLPIFYCGVVFHFFSMLSINGQQQTMTTFWKEALLIWNQISWLVTMHDSCCLDNKHWLNLWRSCIPTIPDQSKCYKNLMKNHLKNILLLNNYPTYFYLKLIFSLFFNKLNYEDMLKVSCLTFRHIYSTIIYHLWFNSGGWFTLSEVNEKLDCFWLKSEIVIVSDVFEQVIAYLIHWTSLKIS